jgi:NADH-quinone oxidoreductase subunit H
MIHAVYDWSVAHIPTWFFILLVVHGAVLGTVAYLILLERKIASWVQDRIGPNRVGLGFGIIPFLKNMKMNGLGQPLADGLKFIMKEDYRPGGVDKVLFTLAPGVMILVIIISIAAVPWGGTKESQRTITIPAGVTDVRDYAQKQLLIGESLVDGPNAVVETPDDTPVAANNAAVQPHHYLVTYEYPFQIASLNIGVLYILAVLSLAVYGVVIGGWASNNKYSFLGGLRATANMISYEIPLSLAVLAIVVMFGTLDLATIVDKQTHYWAGIVPAWNVFTQPLAFFIFLVCIHAEANRAPFDLAEAEQELVGGYHTEYSAMRFALFFLAEYAGMITTSAVCIALFFGGWQFPGIDRLVCGVMNHLFHAGAWVGDPTDMTKALQHPSLTNSMAVCIVRAIVFFTKTIAVIFVFMWVRWSLPRFRFDQLMMLAWRALIPISLAILMMTAIVVWAFNGRTFNVVDGKVAVVLLATNFITLAAIMLISTVLPPAPATNRRMKVIGSRFNRTPVPAGTLAPATVG